MNAVKDGTPQLLLYLIFLFLLLLNLELQTFNFQSVKLVNSKKFYPISYIEHTMQLFNRSRHLLSKHTNTSSFSTTPFPFFKSSAAEWLSENLPSSGDLHSHQATHKRFPDDAQYRIEIPSTEGLESLKSVIEEAKKYNVTVHRVSQGSGINMMPKHETLEMLKIGKAEGMEVCLFVGPRNAWDISAVARTDAGRNAVSGHRGMDQVVFALKEDIGLTSDFDTEDPINYAIGANTPDGVPDPEVGSDVVNRLVFYMRTLKAPTRRNENDVDVIAGDAIFNSVGCVKCHIQTLTTASSEIEALSNKEFHPYTDLLLHDMGEMLNDDYPEGSADGGEWRTPPLWGLGLADDSQGGTGYYLHDGRAASLAQAIGMHGGEAYNVIANYKALSNSDKDKLYAFLMSL